MGENETIKSAQTTVATDAATPAVAEAGNENTDDKVVFTEATGKKTEKPGGEFIGEAADSEQNGVKPETQDKDKPLQSREKNAEFARARREAERQAEIQKAKESAIIETLGGVNPYTQDAMKDSADVEEYLAMKEIQRNGGDPLQDYHKYRKERDRAEAVKQAESRAKEEWLAQDAAAFRAANPTVDMSALINDSKFIKFSKGKIGTVPMTEIYSDYSYFVKEAEAAAKTATAQMLANSKATPGALSTSYTPDSDYFSHEQVAKMSQAEVTKNFEKIRESMKKW